MELTSFVLRSHFRTMCLFETVLNYLCKWGWRMEAQSERKRKGYPPQQSSHTEWIAFVSARAQLFRHSSAITQLLIKHIQQHTLTQRSHRGRCFQLISHPRNTFPLGYLICYKSPINSYDRYYNKSIWLLYLTRPLTPLLFQDAHML